MNSREAAIKIMHTDLATGKATKRSLGVMYAFVMAGAHGGGVNVELWGPINRAILEANNNSRSFLEGVKKVAWTIFEQAGVDAALPDSEAGGTPNSPAVLASKGA